MQYFNGVGMGMPAVSETSRPFEGQDPLAVYDYDLPPELIAQTPARRRVMAKLMLLGRRDGPCQHLRVSDLIRVLRPGDLLVLNDTRVVPARLWALKPTGGRVELLLLRPAQPLDSGPGGEVHLALLRAHRGLAAGMVLALEQDPALRVELLRSEGAGRWQVRLYSRALEVLQRMGWVPLPPYIKRPQGPGQLDQRRYQTVYAQRAGAVAAPTAGLHFSPELLAALERRGVGTTRLTLHVGYGTFAEPSPQDLAAGRLHAEWVDLPQATCRAVARTKATGGRVVAVGTTSMRALEWRSGPDGALMPGQGWCDLLIGEGFDFKVADGLLTNFHLPRTTLLMLVAAFAGRQRVLAAYQQAMERGYRFYSFGDAMLIL